MKKSPFFALSFALGALALVIAGCDGSPALDGGVAVDAGPVPAEPAPPNLLPCPPGWSQTMGGGVATCDPTGGIAPTECGPGEAFFAGSDACTTVGRECPAGDFAEDLPASGVLYVRPGGTGDGTRPDAPAGTIAAALGAASVGTVIALAKGTYDESVAMRSGVRLRGACAAATHLRFTGRIGGTVSAPAGVTGAELADLTIATSDNIGILVQGGDLRVEGVIVEEAMLFGIAVLDGQLTGTDVVVRRTRPATDGSEGGGVLAGEGGTIELSRAVFERNRQFGLLAGAGGRATLDDVASRSQQPGRIPGLGAGVVAESGGVVIAHRLELTDARGAAAFASEGGTLEFRDVVIRGTRGEGNDQGFGIASIASTVRAERIWSDDQAGTSLSLAQRSTLTLVDAVVTRTVPTSARPGWAVGISLAETSAVLERVRVTESSAAALSALGVPGAPLGETSLRGSDISLSDIEDRGTSGVGLYLSGSVEAELERLRIERATQAAIAITDGSYLGLTDAWVVDTRADSNGEFGRGLEVGTGSTADVLRARFLRQREIAVLFGGGGRSSLRDVEIRETLERACASSHCSEQPGGIGLGAYLASQVTVTGFRIDGAPLCGVQLASSGEVDLHDGSIANATVGACVQVEGYDLTRLADGVAYRDTGTQIESTSLYVPNPQDPLAP